MRIAASLALFAFAACAQDKVDKTFLQKIMDAWGTLDPANPAKYYDKSPGNVYFDIAPLKYTGWNAYAEGVKKMFADASSAKFTVANDVAVHPHGGDLVWTTATMHGVINMKAGGKQEADFRWTVLFVKKGGQWLIVHEHVSAPMPEH